MEKLILKFLIINDNAELIEDRLKKFFRKMSSIAVFLI